MPAASYPEGDEQAVAPGASSASEQKGQKQPAGQTSADPSAGSQAGACEQEGDRSQAGAWEREGAKVAFAKDPAEAAVLAKREHKLMFVLHVSGNFEESKFT